MERVLDYLKERYNNKFITFIGDLYIKYKENRVSEIAAQLTYYLVLSIFPYLIFLLNIIKVTPLANINVLDQLFNTLPAETKSLLIDLIQQIVSGSSYTLLSIGALGGIWSASKGIMSLIKSVNRAYGLDENRPFWKLRGLAILLTLLLTFIMIISFGIIIIGEFLFKKIFISYTWPSYVVWKILQLIVTIAIISIIFSILYKMAPSIKEGIGLKFADVVPGGIFASIGLIVSTIALSFYVNNFGNFSKTYGSIGGIIVLLIWLYISSIIIILGAEINAIRLSKNQIKDVKI